MAFNPLWEKIYAQGEQLNRYPFDAVVSFVFRHYPREKKRSEVAILEIGSGAGNNLWFAAREGFRVAGIDGSSSAIQYGRKRFAEEGLEGDFRIGSFDSLPFGDETFDLVFERAALTYCGRSIATRTVEEVRRVLRIGGRFLATPYSNRHSASSTGKEMVDGLMLGGSHGYSGPTCYYNRRDVDALFRKGWKVLSRQHAEITQDAPERYVHAEWRIIVEKTPSARG